MKELTIEEKAKRYDEALKVLHKYDGANIMFTQDLKEEMFPELKESEDESENEKIRKTLIHIVKGACDKYGIKSRWKEINEEKLIAWLEQQGKPQVRTGIEWVNAIDNACDERYTEEYSHGEYCHEQSFKWGFQEGVEWLEKQGETFTKKDVDDAYLKGVTDTKNEIEKQHEATYQIRKDIASFIFNYRGNIKDRAKWINYLGIKVSFVEKQGEHKPTIEMKTPEESLGIDSETYNKIVDECIYGEQKSVDKVEHKFEIGDLITNGILVGKIDEIHELGYHAYFGNHYADVPDAENWHKWTIQDAKDGDVLAFYSEYRGNKMVQVGIIEKYVGKHGGCSNTFKIYVGVNWDNNLQIGEYMGCSDIRPATKEQRDAIMKAMTGAGYTFDFEKKELKKIEQNIEMVEALRTEYEKGRADAFAQMQKEWSEEDEHRLKDAIYFLDTAKKHYASTVELDACIDWFKSLKDRIQPQNTWRPSDEQMRALHDMNLTGNISYVGQGQSLIELYNDLKKL